MVLKRPSISDTGESPGRQRSLNQYYSFTWKMVLKKQFVSNIGKESAVYIHCSGFLGDRTPEVDVQALKDWFWTLSIWEGVAFLQELIFNHFHFGRMWSWKDWFWKFLLWEGVVVLKGQILDNFHLGGGGGHESIWFSLISALRSCGLLKRMIFYNLYFRRVW